MSGNNTVPVTSSRASRDKLMSYGSLSSVDPDDAAMFLREKGIQAIGFGTQKCRDLEQYVDEGHWTWKVLGFSASVMIVIVTLLSFLSHVLSLSPATALVDVYLCLAGLLTCVLEYKDHVLTSEYRAFIKREALFLYRPYGRAALYVLMGLLLFLMDGLLGKAIGALTVFIGATIFKSSMDAGNQLARMKTMIQSEDELAAKFKQFDKDNTGTLDNSELEKLCQSLGSNMNNNEIESALFILDKDQNGKITFHEFMTWWKGKDENYI